MIFKINNKESIIGHIYETSIRYGQHRCWLCEHIFDSGEGYSKLPTSEGKYGSHYSSFCLPCVNKMLMADEDR